MFSKSDAEKFTLTDHARLLRKEDVEGICQSIDTCFDTGCAVRCGPCAIKQAANEGVETNLTIPNMPEVSRLNRRVAALEAALEPFARFAESNTDGEGWAGSRCERERIVDWFGPSDFITVRKALTK